MPMGVMRTLKIMRQLLKEWTLPDELMVSWDIHNGEEIAIAERKFQLYLAEGWLAFSDDPTGKRQILKFDPNLERIVLIPPLGGG